MVCMRVRAPESAVLRSGRCRKLEIASPIVISGWPRRFVATRSMAATLMILHMMTTTTIGMLPLRLHLSSVLCERQ